MIVSLLNPAGLVRVVCLRGDCRLMAIGFGDARSGVRRFLGDMRSFRADESWNWLLLSSVSMLEGVRYGDFWPAVDSRNLFLDLIKC